MGGRFTEIPPETFEQIVVDAGVLLRRFDIFDQDYDITPDIITATTGGVELSAEPEFLDLGEDVDNCANDTKELKRLANWRLTLGSTAIGSSPEIMQMILGAADLSGDIDVIPRAVLELSDFKDLWWVGDRVDGGLLAVHLANALSISGLGLQTGKMEKGQFDFEIQAHVSIFDLDKIPMTFYVMAPGAWEITGLVLQDFFVERGVPTQVPVKFLMGDGSVMEPSDYGRNFTYTAVLPAGGTLTPDGVITLTGKNDTVAMTVTYQKGDTPISGTGTVKVMAAHPVGLKIPNVSMFTSGAAQLKPVIVMSDGEEITPTSYLTGFTYSLDGAPEGASVSSDGKVLAGIHTGVFMAHVTYTEAGRVVTATAYIEIKTIQLPDWVAELPQNISGVRATIGGTVQINYISTGVGLAIDWDPGTSYLSATNTYKTGTKTYSDTRTRNITGSSSSTNAAFALSGSINHICFLGGMVGTYNRTSYVKKVAAFSSLFESGKSLGDNFMNATGLEEAFISGAASFNSATFQNCTSLKTVYLWVSEIKKGTTGTSIPNVFSGCTAIETVDMTGVSSVPVLQDSVLIAGIPTTAQIKVPAALLNDFKTATNWSVRANQFVGV